MKKYIILSGMVFILASSNAQFNKGSKALALGISTISAGTQKSKNANGSTDSKTNNLDIGIQPSIGCFIKNNLLFGVNTMIYYSRQNQPATSIAGYNYAYKSQSFFISAGPYLRKYFENKSLLRPYVEINASIGYQTVKQAQASDYADPNPALTTASQSTTKTSGVLWSIGPRLGFNYLVNQNFGLNVSVGYSHQYSRQKGSTVNSDKSGTMPAVINTGVVEDRRTNNPISLQVDFVVFLEQLKLKKIGK